MQTRHFGKSVRAIHRYRLISCFNPLIAGCYHNWCLLNLFGSFRCCPDQFLYPYLAITGCHTYALANIYEIFL